MTKAQNTTYYYNYTINAKKKTDEVTITAQNATNYKKIAYYTKCLRQCK